MAAGKEVSLEQRQATVDFTTAELEDAAAAWLEARVSNRASPSLDKRLDNALKAQKRAVRRLADSQKRKGG